MTCFLLQASGMVVERAVLFALKKHGLLITPGTDCCPDFVCAGHKLDVLVLIEHRGVHRRAVVSAVHNFHKK